MAAPDEGTKVTTTLRYVARDDRTFVDVDDLRVAIAELCEAYDAQRNPNAVLALGVLLEALP